MVAIAFLVLPLTLAAQPDKGKPKEKTAARKKAAAAKPAPKKPELPAGAVQVSPGRWRYVDDNGKVWMYTRSPMGMMRTEATAGDAPVPSTTPAPPAGIRAFEEGDQVRFEEPMPMGKHVWRRKKTEMNEEERKIWERDTQPKPPAEQPAEAPKQE